MKKATSIAVAAVQLALAAPAFAGYLYSYETNASNLLNSSGNSLPVQNDSIFLSFISPFELAPDSAYNISTVTSSSNVITAWQAADVVLGLSVNGANAPIELAPDNGAINGGLLQCGSAPCFGGTVITNAAGQITAWNLVADSAPGTPFLTFISYNTRSLGAIDALAETGAFAENTLNGPIGGGVRWVGVPQRPVPEPATPWLLLSGLGALGLFAYKRRALL